MQGGGLWGIFIDKPNCSGALWVFPWDSPQLLLITGTRVHVMGHGLPKLKGSGTLLNKNETLCCPFGIGMGLCVASLECVFPSSVRWVLLLVRIEQ